MKRLPLVLCALLFASCSLLPEQTSNTPIGNNLNPAPQPQTPPSAVPAPTAEPVTAIVVTSDLPLRDGPGAAGVARAYLSLNERLTLQHPERGGPWYEVVHDRTGQTGWVYASGIRFGNTSAPLPTPTPKPSPTPTPKPTATPDVADDDTDPDDEINVWVNTDSGVYHCPGSRWYGKTKEGEYMAQGDAVNDGYRPAYGKRCRE